MIEDAYTLGEALGLAVWTTDEAGPYPTRPVPGPSWHPEGQPAQQPHEYVREGTAKLLTLFQPATGQVRTKGVTTCPNPVLHGWLEQELATIVAALPPGTENQLPAQLRAAWERWQADLTVRFTLPAVLPPLRLLLIMDNLAGHHTPHFVVWLCQHGIMPVYTPLGGSWLNMAESIQRILKRRALDGQYPQTPAQIIAWWEAVVTRWNVAPTPFVWGGKRKARRERARQRRHAVGGSGARTLRPLRRRSSSSSQKWRCA